MIFYLCDLSYVKNLSPVLEEDIEGIEDLIDNQRLVLNTQVIERFFFNETREKIEEVILDLSKKDIKVYGVEMGCGLVPLEARYRALVEGNGMINQLFAQYAKEVYLKEAGIDIRIK